MPSWETMVNDVCVNGRPDWLKSASGIWSTVFANAASVSAALRDGATRSQNFWKGAAGDDYRKHLNDLADAIDAIHENNKGVVPLLDQNSKDLGDAQSKMPIPDHMLDQVYNHRAQLDSANSTYGYIGLGLLSPVAVPLFGGIANTNLFGTGHFFNSVVNGLGNVTRDTLGHLKDLFDDQTGKAQEIYDNLNGQYEATTSQAGTPTRSTQDATTKPFTDLGGGGAGGGAGGFGGMPGGGAAGLKKPGTGAGVGSMPGLGSGGVGTGTGTGLDSGVPVGSGLDGAGGGPLSGLGSGPGGFGTSGLGGGLGPLGSGATGLGGAGLGGAGIGKPVDVGGSLAGLPMGAAGRGAGAGRGSAGRGSAAGSRGGMVGGGRHGAGGEDDDRTTWLTEDDDVWGEGNDAAPGVLGGSGW